MALNKAIEHGKEKRKEYRGSKAFDSTCRNHGGCPSCRANRTRYKKVGKLLDKEAEDELRRRGSEEAADSD